jgi:hypothetical protein
MKTAFQHACFAGLSAFQHAPAFGCRLSAFQLLVLAEVLISEGVSLSVLKSVSLREG